MRVKLSISVDKGLAGVLDQVSATAGLPRSRLVERAIRAYLASFVAPEGEAP